MATLLRFRKTALAKIYSLMILIGVLTDCLSTVQYGLQFISALFHCLYYSEQIAGAGVATFVLDDGPDVLFFIMPKD